MSFGRPYPQTAKGAPLAARPGGKFLGGHAPSVSRGALKVAIYSVHENNTSVHRAVLALEGTQTTPVCWATREAKGLGISGLPCTVSIDFHRPTKIWPWVTVGKLSRGCTAIGHCAANLCGQPSWSWPFGHDRTGHHHLHNCTIWLLRVSVALL